jgi:ABC-type polysaccharide/polyol phosphate transport system ATPase subunit
MAKVVLENVRVDFPIYATQRNLRTAIFQRATGGLIQRQGKKQDRIVVKALAGVSMTLEDGDRLGLIGHNGSGKSTLLKVIAGIYEPIEGRLMVEGRVTPLFEMMPGLDPEDSGYENIITAGLLLGLSREEIESRMPEIGEFSELGEYLSLPVRTYSTGMVMRLGFALVTNLDPGILLMDEGIGAGDARFARRAERRLTDFIGRSRILVVASHSPALIRSICNKAALIAAGRILAIGPVEGVFDEYHTILEGAAPVQSAVKPSANGAGAQPGGDGKPLEKELITSIGSKDEVIEEFTKHARDVVRGDPAWPVAEFTPAKELGNEYAECLGGTIETLDGACAGVLEIQAPFQVCLRYRLRKDCPFTIVPNFHFIDDSGHCIFVSSPLELPSSKGGEYVARCVIAPFQFNVGRYVVGLGLSSMELLQPVHFFAHEALRFEVIERPGVDPTRHGYAGDIPGVSRTRLEWHVAKAQ